LRGSAKAFAKHFDRAIAHRNGRYEVAQMVRRKYGDRVRDLLWARVWQVGSGFLFTLKFDDAGNWKIIKTHQMSKKSSKKNEIRHESTNSYKMTQEPIPSLLQFLETRLPRRSELG